MMRKILIAGGGTGGHIFPGLAVAGFLQEQGVEVRWLGATRGMESEIVGRAGIDLKLVDIEGMHARGPAASARALSQLPAAVAAAWKLLLHWRPEAVLGVGGYASASGVMAAGLLGIPWVLQEQNSVPGWTNQVFSPWADVICCGFRDALEHFPSRPAVWTGNPVRREFFEVPDLHPSEKPRVLILGGSQGSLFLNRSLPRVFSRLGQEGIHLQIIHQTGSRWHEVVRTAYEDVGLKVRLEAFLPEPWEAMAESDLVIARSGALTISELAAAGRGALLVPFAAAAGNHQEFNARSLEKAGAAVVLREQDATIEAFVLQLRELLADPARLQDMGSAARRMALPDAAARIGGMLLSLGAR